ncbi:histidine kinase [Microbacterium sp. M28]|uniref:sensor histidine kinase n=1 Tax=Microbacterium sp. M28 TaxID=2962064 RepID=UPI0021F43CB0|nr:histidine kinase [Microbacterium sp. M28]UYO97193.1 histidine kinase [Microbacterium sp. M28]
MTTPSTPRTDAGTAATSARRLARGISATWWYTVSAVIFLEFMLVLLATATVVEAGLGSAAVAVIGIGGLLWWAATLLLLVQYRHRDDAAGTGPWQRIALPLAIAVAYATAAGLASGLWIVAGFAVFQPLVLLNWPRGVRLRLVIAVTAVLIGLWILDRNAGTLEPITESSGWMLAVFSILLPSMSVLSLWWWDVLITLDRARAAESRLGATQERLRVATDVHDLQGHHLQVIALQLELAERLMAKDPAAALDQIRLARTSVDEARQGTRDLALRFRSVPLRDEIANAVDLLRAAGTPAESAVDAAADAAPASVLGPVIRETTTNVLRHGGGKWARLSLTRVAGAWRYEIANDVGASSSDADDTGSGLDGIARRAAEAGGTVEIDRGRGEFTVVVTVPEGER